MTRGKVCTICVGFCTVEISGDWTWCANVHTLFSSLEKHLMIKQQTMRSASLAPLRSLLVSKRLAWANDQTFSGDRFYHLGLPRASIQKNPPLSALVPTWEEPRGAPTVRQMGKQLGSIAALPAGTGSVEFSWAKTFLLKTPTVWVTSPGMQPSPNLKCGLNSSVF